MKLAQAVKHDLTARAIKREIDYSRAEIFSAKVGNFYTRVH